MAYKIKNKNEREIRCQILADRYRLLLNKDIEDYSIGLRNEKTKMEMAKIEKELNELEKKKK